MSELKTKETNKSVTRFLGTIADETKRNDCLELLAMMEEITNSKAKMWGDTIVGFGNYHYKYASGREGDWFVTGFSPRKQNLTIYIMPGFSNYETLMTKIGKHKTSKSCLYVKRLDDLDRKILKRLVAQSVKQMCEIYVCK